MENEKNQEQNNNPYIIEAVRAVGVIKPRFDPNSQGFIPPQLDVIGTAYLLKNYNVIITCKHVVEQLINSPIDLSGMLVIGKQGNYSPVTIGMVDFIHDLAVLRFQKNPRMSQQEFDNFVNQEFSTGLEIANNYSDVSTEVSYAGFPLGMRLLDQQHNPTYSEGIVSIKTRNDNLRKQIQISGPIISGFSGAPIVLKNNPTQLLGMVSNSPSKEAGDANIFMGISWEHIKAIAKLANS